MGIILQCAYEQANNVSVPAPCDAATPDADWWFDHVAKACARMAAIGVTAILLPPVCKTQSGSAISGTGYGVFDQYDIGGKTQCGSLPTRFGTRQQLLRLCAVAAANGLDVYVDVVMHQMEGSPAQTYVGADGRKQNGRFPKKASYFADIPGGVTRDVIAGLPDFPFGLEFAYIDGLPKGEVADLMIASVDWLFRTLGAEGARFDDTKGMNAGFVRTCATSAAMAGKYIFGEFDDGNPYNENAWVENSIFDPDHPGTEGVCSAEDFAFHYAVEAMCNNNSNWNMQQLDHAGLQGMNPSKALTFVENPDTDTDGYATVIWNKAQGYAAQMFAEGYPCVYWKDWSADPGCYGGGGLQPNIEGSCWVNARLAGGPTINRWKTYQFIISERTGSAGLLWGINNDQWSEHSGWVETAFGPNVQLHDYLGHAGDVWTNADGWVLLTLPRNVDGLGTVAYSRIGHEGALPLRGRAITQVVFGAPDLDVGPIVKGESQVLGAYANGAEGGQIWCAANTDIDLSMTLIGASSGASVVLAVTYAGVTVGRVTGKGTIRTTKAGWHTIVGLLGSTAQTADQSLSYELTVTYTAPKTI